MCGPLRARARDPHLLASLPIAVESHTIILHPPGPASHTITPASHTIILHPLGLAINLALLHSSDQAASMGVAVTGRGLWWCLDTPSFTLLPSQPPVRQRRCVCDQSHPVVVPLLTTSHTSSHPTSHQASSVRVTVTGRGLWWWEGNQLPVARPFTASLPGRVHCFKVWNNVWTVAGPPP